MQEEPGDDYIRRIAGYIRENEVRLAHAGLGRRRKAHSVPNYSIFNPLGWVGLADSNASQSPVVLSMDTHHLFYLLMRLEALGIDIGTLDVQLDDLSRPLSYIDVGLGKDKSETLSIAESFRSSFSAVSKLSLGSAWWSRTEPRTVEDELKYIYSSFTKLPALSITAPGPKVVTELAHDPPLNNAIPLDSFKFLLSLECVDVDPRALLGWDKLAESLRSLTIKRSGLDNPAHIFLDAVVDDQLRREGDATRSRIRKLGHRVSHRGFHSSNLPETVQEESEDDLSEESSSAPVLSRLSPLKWAFLKHLSLADNALTTIPSSMLPPLTSLTHLDLSSNLLVSIPQLSPLYNLTSLNLSDNMIDSVLGIYKKLGQVLVLNLARNRLDSLCGLERLMAIERIDLRNNVIDESAEVGRLAVLPNISEVWIEGNPFVEAEENYRVRCFDYFWKEGKTIMLDGALPGFYERRNRTAPLPDEVSPPRVPVAPYSPPTLPVGSAAASKPRADSQMLSSGSSSNVPSPSLQPLVAKPKKKRNKRIVALDGGESDYRSSEDGGRIRSEPQRDARSKSPPETLPTAQEGSPQSKEEAPIRRSRHSRYRTEVTTPISPSIDAFTSTSPRSGTAGSLGRRTSSTRRNRLSASMYEPPNVEPNETDSTAKQMRDAEQFRAKIEALRAEMGDNWLQVLSQTQLRSEQSTKR
ncbi:uncharacterized protein FOMMEDRAFT_168108 [Fomitiporia mediterranea MF3/22]|uniref:uncharacterized protein n=1 Tax=Fomitiporia mediterranea (strain MF3/22) TaxID=694068 RepID=UPI0004407E2E|nr:uncharacterized protein FOMMEDRAFT_168108 [Fomitiporia mediterranea MF3/22]EJD03020.1 hypothetical protein FOMMEDRAFT_168108 [Fomitiporia mediterranea MF3/22]